MKLSAIQRLGGYSMILGAVFLFFWTLCRFICLPSHIAGNDFNALVQNPNWKWVISLSLPGVIFTIFGFTAVYSRLYRSSGFLGLIGYIFIVLSYLHQLSQIVIEIFIYPIISETAPILLGAQNLYFHPLFSQFRTSFYFLMAIGLPLFCLAIIRSKEFPKSSGFFILSGAILYAIGPMITIYVALSGIVILSTGCFILGKKLLSAIPD